MADNTIYERVDLPSIGKPVEFSLKIKNGHFGTTSIELSGGERVSHEGDFSIPIANSDTLDGKKFDFNVVCSDPQNTGGELLVEVQITGIENSSPWKMVKSIEKGEGYAFFGTVKFNK